MVVRQPRSVAFAVNMAGGQTPLEFMLMVMRDDKQDLKLRCDMAKSAAPYCHPKLMDQRTGKKQLASELARAAAESDEWGDDLAVN